MINKIKENVWQLYFSEFGSCVYLLEINNKKIIIDAGSAETLKEMRTDLTELNINPMEIDIIIFTHFHPDHIEGSLIFKNAEFYASKKDFGENVKDILQLKIPEMKIIETPGHTKGSICILYEDILFSGDTIFHNGGIGRMDLPGGSVPDMKESLEKLKKIKYKILCPGHM